MRTSHKLESNNQNFLSALFSNEGDLRANDEQLEEKYRVQKDQMRHLETILEKVYEKLASSE